MTAREKRGEDSPPLWSSLLAAESVATAMAMVRARAPVVGFDWRREALEGGLPPAALAASDLDRQLWFEGYVVSHLQRDLRDLTQVADLPAFARLMRLAALRAGGLVNQADFSRDASVSRASAARWLSLLETSFVVHLLPAFATSRSKRLIKTPKVYLFDTGLLP